MQLAGAAGQLRRCLGEGSGEGKHVSSARGFGRGTSAGRAESSPLAPPAIPECSERHNVSVAAGGEKSERSSEGERGSR
jgi:hypothetical protein